MSFCKKVFRHGDNSLFLITTKENNLHPCWYFFKAHHLKLEIFLKRISKGSVNLREYGEIIFSGYGEWPPEEYLARMEQEYHFYPK